VASTRRALLWLAVLICSSLSVFSACQQPTQQTSKPLSASNAGVRLVTLLPLTGSLASKGPSRERAAKLAALHINQAGGLSSGPLRLDHLDSGTSSTVALAQLSAYLRMSGKPDVLIGASSSQVSREVLKLAQQERFPMISPASTASSFTTADTSDLFFRTVPSDAFQGTVLAERIYESGVRRLGLIYQDDAYGTSLKETLANAFMALGGEIVQNLPYLQGDTESLSKRVPVFLQTPMDGICLIGYPQEAPGIFNAWIDSVLQPEVKWFFSDGLKASQTIAGIKEPFRLDQSFGTVPSSLPQEASARFEQDYLAAYQEIPVSFAAHTYDAVALAALALQRRARFPEVSFADALREVSSPPGTIVGPGEKSLKEALLLLSQGEPVNYEGASGGVDFDAQGDVLSDYEIWTFKRGFIFRVETRTPAR
jgi:branched-chain amino acid transport system substrate-binding protein